MLESFEYYFQCEECSYKKIKKSYVQRYKISLIDNEISIREKDITVFLEHKKKSLDCKGKISLHDRFYSEYVKLIK